MEPAFLHSLVDLIEYARTTSFLAASQNPTVAIILGTISSAALFSFFGIGSLPVGLGLGWITHRSCANEKGYCNQLIDLRSLLVQLTNFSITNGIYRNNLKNRFLPASDSHCFLSRLHR